MHQPRHPHWQHARLRRVAKRNRCPVTRLPAQMAKTLSVWEYGTPSKYMAKGTMGWSLAPSDDWVVPIRNGQHPVATPLPEGVAATWVAFEILDQELV